MYRYILKRIFMMVFVVLGVSFLVYFIIDLAPGDIIGFVASDHATQEDIVKLRHEYGLDRPVIVRYLDYMKNFLRGDMGTSYITGKSVFSSFMEKIPNTLMLTGCAVVVSILISLPLGIIASIHRGTWKDNICSVFALLGMSMPHFWLGLLLIILFALKLGWLPSGGYGSIKHLILPAITVGTGLTAMLMRTTRSSMLDVSKQDYLRTARSKGVPEKLVIRKHALKNALIPIITIIGTQFAACLGGTVLTETVFAWPGVGRLIIDSVNSRDTTMVTGCIILKSIVISIVLLIVDLLYAYVDPRIKAQYSKGGKV